MKVLTIQPSSAAAERVFLLLIISTGFGDLQENSFRDYTVYWSIDYATISFNLRTCNSSFIFMLYVNYYVTSK